LPVFARTSLDLNGEFSGRCAEIQFAESAQTLEVECHNKRLVTGHTDPGPAVTVEQNPSRAPHPVDPVVSRTVRGNFVLVVYTGEHRLAPIVLVIAEQLPWRRVRIVGTSVPPYASGV